MQPTWRPHPTAEPSLRVRVPSDTPKQLKLGARVIQRNLQRTTTVTRMRHLGHNRPIGSNNQTCLFTIQTRYLHSSCTEKPTRCDDPIAEHTEIEAYPNLGTPVKQPRRSVGQHPKGNQRILLLHLRTRWRALTVIPSVVS